MVIDIIEKSPDGLHITVLRDITNYYVSNPNNAYYIYNTDPPYNNSTNVKSLVFKNNVYGIVNNDYDLTYSDLETTLQTGTYDVFELTFPETNRKIWIKANGYVYNSNNMDITFYILKDKTTKQVALINAANIISVMRMDKINPIL